MMVTTDWIYKIYGAQICLLLLFFNDIHDVLQARLNQIQPINEINKNKTVFWEKK